MKRQDIVKVLETEQPMAKQTAIYRDGGSKDYEAPTSIGIIEFHVPIQDQRNIPITFHKEMPAHLLTHWLKHKDPEKHFQIHGTITTPDDVTEAIFNDKLTEFMEANSFKFGGGTVEVDDRGKPI